MEMERVPSVAEEPFAAVATETEPFGAVATEASEAETESRRRRSRGSLNN